MKKKVLGILVCSLLVASGFGCATGGDTDRKHMENPNMGISVIQDLIVDAQSTTGPLAPLNYDTGLANVSLNDKIIINNVPIYLWYNGCGPTAAGMVIGYWDSDGFDDLVDGYATSQTASVNRMISSSGNYYDYCLPKDGYPNLLPDKSELPEGDEHDDNCVADFMKTSQSFYDNYYGWSWFSDVTDGLKEFIKFKNSSYEPITRNYRYSSGLWNMYCKEIDEGRPVVLLVDTGGDGVTDHFITAVGYDDNMNYACYNTWDTNIHWYDFSKMKGGNTWGIYGATFCSFSYHPLSPSNPYPADGSINVDINIILQWECKDPDGDNVYHIYFGKRDYLNEEDLLVSNLTEKYYNISGLEKNADYSWKVVAEDEHGSQHQSNEWKFATRVPCAPDIEGPTQGKTDRGLTYTASTTDTEGEEYYWFFNWGDDTNSGWFGPYSPGEKASTSHAWDEEGEYTLKVRYREDGVTSDWGTLEVSMPRNKPYINTPFLQFLQNFLQNHPLIYQLLQRLLKL